MADIMEVRAKIAAIEARRVQAELEGKEALELACLNNLTELLREKNRLEESALARLTGEYSHPCF
jgi:hypothetical protein